MISREEVEGLARLARLELGPEEIAALQADITDILAYVGQVSAAASGSQAPQVPALHNVLRRDAVRPSDDPLAGREPALRAAFPRRQGDFDLVRTIIQKDE